MKKNDEKLKVIFEDVAEYKLYSPYTKIYVIDDKGNKKLLDQKYIKCSKCNKPVNLYSSKTGECLGLPKHCPNCEKEIKCK